MGLVLFVVVFAIVLVHVILFSWWAYWTVRRRKFWQTPAGVEYNRLRREEMSNIESGSLSVNALEAIIAKQAEKIQAHEQLQISVAIDLDREKILQAKLEAVEHKMRQQDTVIESGRAQDGRREKVIQDLRSEVFKLRKHIAAMIVNTAIPKEAPPKPSYTVSQNQSCDGLMWNEAHPKKFYASSTGGQKDIAGKPRLDLVPIEFVEGAALAFEFGAKKYSAHNWRKGVEVSILIRSLLSHVMKYNNGEDKDHESNLHHLDHACATLAMLITTAKTMPHMDNRYGKALRTPFGEFIVRQEAAGNAINTNYRESGGNSEGRV